jgi:hypothetical protein
MHLYIVILIYLLTAVGLTPGDSSTVHIHTQTVHNGVGGKNNTKINCGPCPVLASYTLAFALQLRKKHGKTSVRVAEQKEYIDLTIKIHKLQY